MRRQQPQKLRRCQVWRNSWEAYRLLSLTLCKGCHFLIALVFRIVALSPLDELQCQVGCQKTFVLKAVDARAAVNLAVFPVLSDHFPVTEETPREEKECVFVQYVHLPPAVYLLWMWGRLLLTMETIISAITYPITVKPVHVLCVRTSWRDRNMENENCALHKWKSVCVCGKPLVHHFSCDYHCTFCNQPAASLLLFK